MATQRVDPQAALVHETQFAASVEDEARSPSDAASNVRPQAGNYSAVTPSPVLSPSPIAPRSEKPAGRALGPDLLRGTIIVLQALDHGAGSVNAWQHGVANVAEQDGVIMDKWNTNTGWAARMLTHLCAPGFTFLLGMGVVYLGRSRTKLGWTHQRFLKHFFIRGFVLALVNQVLGVVISFGSVWLLNIVLLALAIDYVLAGFLWLLLRDTEKVLADVVAAIQSPTADEIEEERPLLANEASTNSGKRFSRAETLSFHLHNLLLLSLSIVTIFWNVWFSPTGGHCDVHFSLNPREEPAVSYYQESFSIQANSTGGFHGEDSSLFNFMFHVVVTPKIMSGFPPLAWISFAFLGLLYGRLVIRQPQRSPRVVSAVTALAGLAFALLFVATRIFEVGNLSQGCLHMPEQEAQPAGANQYLASIRSFFYVVKYPPSPAYACYTMAVNLLLLAAFTALPPLDSLKNQRQVTAVATGAGAGAGAAATISARGVRATGTNGGDGNSDTITTDDSDEKESIARRILGLFYAILLPYGQCALFFYALHILMFNMLGLVVKAMLGRRLDYEDPFTGRVAYGLGNGPLFWIYWFACLAVLWFACRAYGRFKARQGPDSIWRFF